MQIIYAFLLTIFLAQGSNAAINKISRGPYLQKPSPNSISIRWRTKKPSISLVQISENGSSQTHQDLILKTEHEIRINNLQADKKYIYSILAEKKNKREIIKNNNNSNVFSFKTFPAKKEITSNILILGDPGILSDRSIKRSFREDQEKVIQGYELYTQEKEISLDLVLTLGDNAYHNGTDKEFQKGFFTPYTKLLANTPLLTCFGNHDSGLDREFLSYTARSYPQPKGIYYSIFSLPGKKAYYSFDHGAAHFIVLDSFDSLWEDLKTDHSNYEKVWDETSIEKNSMLEWFKKDLETSLSTWNIVIFHHPPFTKDTDYERQDIWRAWVNSYIVPLVEESKIDLVLSGHIHNYQRSFPIASVEKEVKREFCENKHVKKHKKKFFEQYLDKKRDLKLRNYEPVITSQEKNNYKKGNGVIYSIIGSSGAAFKELEANPQKIFAERLQEAGSLILNIDSDSLDYNFVGVEGKVLDSFIIQK